MRTLCIFRKLLSSRVPKKPALDQQFPKKEFRNYTPVTALPMLFTMASRTQERRQVTEAHMAFAKVRTSSEWSGATERGTVVEFPNRKTSEQPERVGSRRKPETAAALESRDQLVLEHMPLVGLVARRLHGTLPAHVEFEELESAGVLGLMDAAAKFDLSKHVLFKSYAQFRIRGAILDSLRASDWGPRELRRQGRAVQASTQQLMQHLGRAATEQEIAQHLGLDLPDYQQLLGSLKSLEIASLHEERFDDSGEEELASIAGSPDEDPLARCLQGEMRQRLAEAIEQLPERERLVLTLYYFEELTMREIGLAMGVVESRVSQLRASAVLRLRPVFAQPSRATGRTVKNHAVATKPKSLKSSKRKSNLGCSEGSAKLRAA